MKVMNISNRNFAHIGLMSILIFVCISARCKANESDSTDVKSVYISSNKQMFVRTLSSGGMSFSLCKNNTTLPFKTEDDAIIIRDRDISFIEAFETRQIMGDLRAFVIKHLGRNVLKQLKKNNVTASVVLRISKYGTLENVSLLLSSVNNKEEPPFGIKEKKIYIILFQLSELSTPFRTIGFMPCQQSMIII